MTTTLTGSDSYSNTVAGPADGETRNAASVNNPMQTLLNTTRYLYQHGRILNSGTIDSNSSDLGNTDTSWADASYTAITFTGVEVGDIVIAEGAISVSVGSAGAVPDTGSFRIGIVDGATTYGSTQVPNLVCTAGNSTASPSLSLHNKRVVTNAGTITVKIQHILATGDGANNTIDYENAYVHAYLVRI